MENTDTNSSGEVALRPKRSGRKRLIIASGAVLGTAALITAAAFTDFGLLDLNGTGGFGGEDNVYNLQFSAGQEDTVTGVTSWIEANPTAANVAPITGADTLIPGGAPLYVKLPVLNESANFGSTLSVVFENTTPVTVPANVAQDARNTAYAGLMTIEVATTADATDPATYAALTWSTPLTFTAGSTASAALPALVKQAGTIVLVRVKLLDGTTQALTNAANGGGATVQARFDGTSTN